MSFNLTVIAQAVAFALFIWFTVKFVWPPLLRAIEARQKTIADGLAAGEQGRKSLEVSNRQAEQAIQDARAFLQGNLDYLAIGPFLVAHPSSR